MRFADVRQLGNPGLFYDGNVAVVRYGHDFAAFVLNRTVISARMCNAYFMPQLVVVEKIDGNPVAWRCSECRQNFSARGKLTTQQRLQKVNKEFKLHMEESHKDEAARPREFAAAAPPHN